ncbi:hypothetical protein PsexTeo8_61550 (plasmid) [Pseudomonas extremaustralis]|nr:hypothetical protein [Pseudomonas extremaustralis]
MITKKIVLALSEMSGERVGHFALASSHDSAFSWPSLDMHVSKPFIAVVHTTPPDFTLGPTPIGYFSRSTQFKPTHAASRSQKHM